jgi:selenocysteine lyase/cysteine desulfurase
MAARGLREIVRASVSYLNTEDEIARLVRAVAGLAR